uniref:Uncharacterized protein n=1 Tax=Arundo donax TaxID=35708 RepID=A0A0A9D9G8_ARUDO
MKMLLSLLHQKLAFYLKRSLLQRSKCPQGPLTLALRARKFRQTQWRSYSVIQLSSVSQ